MINFSFCKNVDDAVTEKALFVPSIGKVTVAMLERNIVRLYHYNTAIILRQHGNIAAHMHKQQFTNNHWCGIRYDNFHQ